LRERIGAWQGIALIVVAVGATVWLGATGRLALYIHPRYVEFTLAMAVVAGVFAVAAVGFGWMRGRRADAGGHGDHDHDDHEHGAPAHPLRRTVAAAGSVAVAVVAAVCLVVIPPATLTSATAADREMNAGAPVLAQEELISVGGDFSSFTVKDWASVLGQISSPEFFAGTTVEAVGFVTADAVDPENVYYVSRFIVTCCAVDAQPVGVPVHEPGWAGTLAENEWVHVIGPLVANPGTAAEGSPAIVLQPTSVEVVDEPADPYVH
jgi:uncharacterized repeat protein (TIGR03943 family)